jgi:hypothetical protein
VQVVYAHASDVADRFSDLASSLVAWTANVDTTFSDSATETGGVRHVRWVTDASCQLVIQRVLLSTNGDDTYGNTVAELQSVGLNRSDRKYLIWVDSNVYCGVASFTSDDSAGLTNANNTGSGYARTDNGCWGKTNSAEAHELMHILGGVQLSAPHSTGGGHCTDEYDQMCYGDGPNVAMTYPCNSLSRDRLFDCNHDDYFSTNPPAGSYLATHWNTASSSFLAPAAPDAWSSTTTTTSTTSPSPSPTPASSSSTVTFSGALNRKTTSQSFPIAVGSGPLTATLTFTKAKSVTLSLLTAGGSTVTSRSGGSPNQISVTVSAGTYSLTVSGSGNASFSVAVAYASP